jgi:6-pyruvoyltetrahydropterin/6-carboxytetrahydropterin synthase
MIYLTIRTSFCAAKRLWNPALSEQENRETFGICSTTHGHDYLLEVTLRGEPDPATGLLYDVLELRNLLEEEVVKRLDHRELDKEVDLLEGQVASVENLASAIYHHLKEKLPRGLLHEVRVWESQDAVASCREE